MISFSELEQRNLLAAGIFFNAGSGEVFVGGDSSNDVGQFERVGRSYRATINDQTRRFDLNQVSKVTFIGFGGDDRFSNLTSVEGLLLGNDGDDVLVGGSGFDQINGGNGADEIRGGEGNDRLIGGNGADRIFGGVGADSIFGGAGQNQIEGNAGNDIIFGGNDVDVVFGGDGADQIFGLEGNDILSSGNGGVLGSAGSSQADLVLGLGGNDTITGGAGLNVLYGGEGNDTISGGIDENRIHGQNGNDELRGGSGSDYLAGNNGDDTLIGFGAVDFLLPGFGNDSVNGGAADDIVIFNGASVDFQISENANGFLVTDTRAAGNGANTIVAAETLRFTDGDRDGGTTDVERVTVQPIIVSNSDGTNTAEFFGNAQQSADIMAKIDDIFEVAGVDIEWLVPTTWNDTFANVGNNSGGTRPGSDLTTVTRNGDSEGVGNSNNLVIDMYFVEIAAGFSNVGENVANGLAFVNNGGITMHVGDRLVGFENGRDVVARVAAHEIAHNLGLRHVNDSDNLMGDGDQLNASQIAQILASNFSRPI